MGPERIGEMAALATALCWTVTAMAFETAGRKIGSLSVNLIRLVIAFLVFCVLSLIRRGVPLPLDAPPSVWFWLLLSGAVGFVLGDLFLFQAFVLIGSRVSMLIYASVPPLTAVMGWIILGETMGMRNVVGMVVTMAGIAVVVLQRSAGEAGANGKLTQRVPDSSPAVAPRPVRLAHPVKGVLYAFGGALGQAGGLVLSKLGAPNYDPFGATQIRGIAGIIGFAVIVTVMGRWPSIRSALSNRSALGFTGLGAFFGPFLGVSLGLFAIQHASTGVASTIMALTPVLIIVPSVVLRKERVGIREILGATIAVGGTALLFL